MPKHVTLLSLFAALQLAAGCDLRLVLEPDEPPPASGPDAGTGPAPDAGPGYPMLPPPEAFPDAPVVTTPEDAPAPPPEGVAEGVHIVFPPPAGITTARHVSMRGVARLPAGVTAVRVNGVDARLSPPNAEGAVAWRVDLAPARGRNDVVVSSTDGDGDTTAEAARGAIEFAPHMLAVPQVLDIDVGHDRLFVSDPGVAGIVAIDLETGAPARADLAPSADVSVAPHAMSIDAAAGRGVALFYQSVCAAGVADQILETHGIDLQTGAVTLEERVLSSGDCNVESGAPAVYESHVVLDAAEERFFVAHQECTVLLRRRCTTGIRARRLGGGGAPAADLEVCSDEACEVVDMVADRRDGFGLLALVRRGDLEDPAFELRAIDPEAGTQSTIATIDRGLDALSPLTMALDPAGDRLLVLASGEAAQKFVVEIDLTGGAQWRRFVNFGEDASEIDPGRAPGLDAVYDPRRDRLILAGAIRGGLYTVDVGSGALARLFHPSVGDGPALWCDYACSVSTVDERRQRFFVLASSQPGFPTFPDGLDIFEVDLRTGRRRVVSEHTNELDFEFGARLLADFPEDRLLVIDDSDEEDSGLYTVDIATGERAYVGQTVLRAMPINPSGWDPELNRVLYMDAALHAHDVDTFEDTVLSSDTLGSGPSLAPVGDPQTVYRQQDVALDASGTRALVSQVHEGVLISVDLATGDRTAHPMAEPADRSSWPHPVLVDAPRDRILVGDFTDHSIGAIDLSTGASSIFLDVSPDRWISDVADLIPDHRNERALVVDGASNVRMVDLQTGEHVLILRGQP